MAKERPTTVSAYIQAAPPEARPHLRQLRAILKSVAPEADEVIKWGNPFFVEPRFLFAYSAHKAHVSFAPTGAALKAFSKELQGHATTTNFLKIPYNKPLPEALIRKLGEYCLRAVRERKTDSFW